MTVAWWRESWFFVYVACASGFVLGVAACNWRRSVSRPSVPAGPPPQKGTP